MNELLIGVRDWNEPRWADTYYPEDMPEDWRFCFYSNNLRSVLIPATIIENVRADEVGDWAEDSDPGFSFILEIPPAWLSSLDSGSVQEALSNLKERISAIESQVAGLLWRPDVSSLKQRDKFEAALDLINQHFPVCVDVDNADLRNLAVAHGAGICWQVDKEPQPFPGGRFMLALVEESDNRRQREVIERSAAWLSEDATAGLFFYGDRAGKNAEEARVIAELLGV